MIASTYQQRILEHARNVQKKKKLAKRVNLSVRSAAGSGKSTTARLVIGQIVEADPAAKIIAIQFNKHIQEEMEKKLISSGIPMSNIQVKTTHGIGLAILSANGYRAKGRINTAKYFFLSKEIVDHNEDEILNALNPDGKTLDPTKKKMLLTKAVSQLTEVVKMAMNTLTVTDSISSLSAMIEKHEILVFDPMILKFVDKVLKAGIQGVKNGNISFEDMICMPSIMKMRFITYDYVICDEQQDFNAAQLELVAGLKGESGVIFSFGDEMQCNPAGTKVMLPNGTEKNIEDIKVGDTVASFCRNEGRFARGVVEEIDSREVKQKLYEITWNDKKVQCTENHKFVVKWSSEFMADADNKYIVYLMRKGKKYRIGKTKLFTTRERSCEFGLRTRMNREKADAAWVLHFCHSETEALVKEQIASYKYGIPMMMFIPVISKYKNHFNEHAIELLFNSVGDLEQKACELMKDYNLWYDYPFISTQHQRFEKFGGQYFSFVLEACNMKPGIMSIPNYNVRNSRGNGVIVSAYDNKSWSPIEDIQLTEEFEGIVHSLKIDRKTYISNGIPTHNSIMAFSGAMTDSVPRFIEKFNARRLKLSICYRCPSRVLDLARILVPSIENRDNCPEGIVEHITQADIAEKAKAGDHILCRLTAPLVSMCLRFIRKRVPAKVKGREIGAKLVKTYEEIVTLADPKPNHIDEFIGVFKEYKQEQLARATIKKDPPGKIQMMTDQFDCIEVIAGYISQEAKEKKMNIHHSQVKAEIESLFSDDTNSSYIILCTVHKAKGLECDNVFIIEFDKMPFKFGGKELTPENMQQERNIMYVAITRAKNALYIQGNGIASYQDIVDHITRNAPPPVELDGIIDPVES